MSVELTEEVSSRLGSDNFGWLTTVAKSGQPVPRLVWFYFDGTKLTVYSMPQAGKVAHIKAHPQVSLNLDSDGNGGGIIVIGGMLQISGPVSDPAVLLGAAAILLATINIAGGFLVTQRMLRMFQRH